MNNPERFADDYPEFNPDVDPLVGYAAWPCFFHQLKNRHKEMPYIADEQTPKAVNTNSNINLS